MMKRIVALGDKHPWMVIWGLVVFVLLVLAVSITLFIRSENKQTAKEAKERAELVATSAEATCKAAVQAVTDQGKTDDLKILDVIKSRFEETGRPVPALYLALELEVKNRQAPLAACIPKESP